MKPAFCLVALLLSGATAFAQRTEIEETALYEYDVSTLKAGDWIEYADPAAMDVVTSRFACTKVEKNIVWIEMTDAWIDRATGKRDEQVLLLGVSKVSNLILFGYAGKPGEVGRKHRVTERHEMRVSAGGGKPEEGRKIPPEEERVPIPSEDAKCTILPEPEDVEVGEQKIRCEKWTLEHIFGGDKPVKRIETFWISDKIPFRRRLDKLGNPMIFDRDVPFEGKRTLNGGIVKRTSGSGDRKYARVLKAFGTDAKPTLKTKSEDEAGKK